MEALSENRCDPVSLFTTCTHVGPATLKATGVLCARIYTCGGFAFRCVYRKKDVGRDEEVASWSMLIEGCKEIFDFFFVFKKKI